MELEVEDETHYSAKVTTRIGPIRATFKGRVELTDIEASNSLKLAGNGEGGLAGFAHGEAAIKLRSGGIAGRTVLSYVGQVAVGGKMAKPGSRLIDGVARKMAAQFFDALAARIEEKPNLASRL